MALTLAALLAHCGPVSNLLSILASLATLQAWWANRQERKVA